jgi:hypothetical protein
MSAGRVQSLENLLWRYDRRGDLARGERDSEPLLTAAAAQDRRGRSYRRLVRGLRYGVVGLQGDGAPGTDCASPRIAQQPESAYRSEVVGREAEAECV